MASKLSPGGPSPSSPGSSHRQLVPLDRPLLWLATASRRSVVAAHLDHVGGRFAAEGWRVYRGDEPPRLPETGGGAEEMPVAVMTDPWIEPFAAAARTLAAVLPVRAAAAADPRWRVPRLTGLEGPQGWVPRWPPWTLRQARARAVQRRWVPGRAVRAQAAGGGSRNQPGHPPLLPGFAVAPAGEARRLLAGDAALPRSEDCVLVPEVRFFRYPDPADHERREILPWVPEEARLVVDVGCGHGRLGELLRRPGRTVVGIEPDPTLARAAGRRLDQVLAGRAEDMLPTLGRPVDCFVFADVLEHLVEPEALLRRARGHLADDGVVVASVPNSAWAPVLRDLAAGHWEPTLAGVQARDHLRPFTPASFERTAEECGFRVERRAPLAAPLPWRLRLWAWLVARSAGGDPRHLTAPQWLMLLRPAP